MRYLFITLALTATLHSKPLQDSRKIFYTNVLSSALILTYGYFQWDYKKGSFSIADEGWFDRDTKHGGVDKFGHFYTNYLMTQLLTSLYQRWGYSKEYSAKEAVYSSLIINAIMEIGDGFGDFGFSYEDILFNVLGAYSGYYLLKNPDLSKRIDIRWEYFPSEKITKEGSFDILTDYEGMKFLVAVKFDGFETVKRSFFKYFEFHVGYYTRKRDDEINRYPYMAVGVNLSHLLKPVNRQASRVFNYYQLPYSYKSF